MKRALIVAFVLAAVSHLLSAVFPFVAAAGLKGYGVIPATLAFYSIGSAALCVWLCLSGKFRAEVRYALGMLWKKQADGGFLAAMVAFSAAAICYYHGLAAADRKLEYMFLTRLDWVMQIPAAIILLKEKWHYLSVFGAAAAALGAVLIGAGGGVGISGVVWAGGFVGGSIAAYICISRLLKTDAALSPAAALAVRSFAITAVLLLLGLLWVLCLGRERLIDSPQTAAIWVVLAAAFCLTALFLCRFEALKRMPLWLFSALAPLQALGGVLIAWHIGQAPSAVALTGVLLICAGEVLVGSGEAMK